MQQTISIPTSLDEINLWQVQAYERVSGIKDDFEQAVQIVSIFANKTEKEVRDMPTAVIFRAVQLISSALNDKPQLRRTFELRSRLYGLIPNFDDMTAGEFIDLNTYEEKGELINMLSVLYRPITIQIGDKYEIEPYKGTLRPEFRDVSVNVAYGSQLFFWNIGNDLSNYILRYLRGAAKKQMTSDSVKSGDGLQRFIHYVEAMSRSLRKLQSRGFIHAYNGLLMSRMSKESKN